jgi:hypothetical protein
MVAPGYSISRSYVARRQAADYVLVPRQGEVDKVTDDLEMELEVVSIVSRHAAGGLA